MPADTLNIDGLMLDAAYEALLIVNERLEVVKLNSSATALFGGQHVEGMLITELLDSTDLNGTLDYIIQNREQDFEVQTRIDDRFFRVRTRLLNDDDDHTYVGIAMQDVTELVRLNRARRDMVANISHELRNPVAKIRLIIDTLFHEEDKPKRKKSIQSLRDIARETDSLQWIVQEMLDLSMIESGQSIVRMVDVPVAEIIEEAVERMNEQAYHRDMSIEIIPVDNLNVLCDRDLSRRVIVNLLHNAIKYSPEESKITVSASDNGEYVKITVSDEGPGLPADQTKRVFERFYQVDSSRTKSEGTGLGLAICRHIVEAHGGEIWADPVEDVGSGQFSFTLLNADYAEDVQAGPPQA
ncbi:MAG: PAS domain-containing sensor histidine kinase [Chloroflexota bacterium]